MFDSSLVLVFQLHESCLHTLGKYHETRNYVVDQLIPKIDAYSFSVD